MKKTILTLIAIIGMVSVKSQNLYNQTTIYISTSSLLYVSGDLVNTSLIVNNGDMQVGGTWTNNGTYDAGTGKITFTSDLPQTINHNAQSFSRLTISGTGVKTFSADLTIVDELNLENGLLVSQNNSRILFNPDAVIIGGSNQSHINGPVYQQGTGDKLFPVGNGTTYLPVELLGITTSSEVGVNMVEFSAPQSFEFNTELSAVSDKRYWEVDVVSGSLTGTKISLPLNGDEGFTTNAPTTQYVIAQSSDSPIEFESLGQSNFTGSTTSARIISDQEVTANLVSIGILSEGIEVFNAISADGDERNAILKINNITSFTNNKVSIFNRWGDKVFEVKGYDNDQSAFRGDSNIGGTKELPAGTYFYVIDLGDGSALVNGYLSLKR